MCLNPQDNYPNPEENVKGPIYRYKCLSKTKDGKLHSPIFKEEWVIGEWRKAAPQEESRKVFSPFLNVDGATIIEGSQQDHDHGFHVYFNFIIAKINSLSLRNGVSDSKSVIVKVEVRGFIAGSTRDEEETWERARIVEQL